MLRAGGAKGLADGLGGTTPSESARATPFDERVCEIGEKIIANTITIERVRRAPAVEAHVARGVDLAPPAPHASATRVYQVAVAATLIAVQGAWIVALVLGAARLIG